MAFNENPRAFNPSYDRNRSNNRNFSRGSNWQGYANDEPFVEAEIWLNIGYYEPSDSPDAIDGYKFIQMRKGLPLDTMPQFEHVVSRNKDWMLDRKKGNQLQEKFLRYAEDMEPGETRIVFGDPLVLCAQLRKRMTQDEDLELDEGTSDDDGGYNGGTRIFSEITLPARNVKPPQEQDILSKMLAEEPETEPRTRAKRGAKVKA